MAVLVCDVCGGKLVMRSGGIATCESCGMEYSTDRMKEKFIEMKGTAGLDNSQGYDRMIYEENDGIDAKQRRKKTILIILLTLAVIVLFVAVYFGYIQPNGGSLIHLHNYEVTAFEDATCDKDGYKDYKCSTCDRSYREDIKTTGHKYSPATCDDAATCMKCGHVSGSALGHTDGDAKCSRCGVTIFQTLSYSGTGSKVIDYVLPRGKFKVTVTMTSGRGFVDAKVHYASTYVDTYEWFYIINAGESKVEYIDGPQTYGSIVVNASDSYWGNSGWKITIEAVS